MQHGFLARVMGRRVQYTVLCTASPNSGAPAVGMNLLLKPGEELLEEANPVSDEFVGCYHSCANYVHA